MTDHSVLKPHERMRAEAARLRAAPKGFWAKVRYYMTTDALDEEIVAQHYERCAKWVEDYYGETGTTK